MPGGGAGTPAASATRAKASSACARVLSIHSASVGEYPDTNYLSHGYLRAPDGTITEFDVPGAGTGAGQGTTGGTIDPAGRIVGNYVDSDGVSHGFLWIP